MACSETKLLQMSNRPFIKTGAPDIGPQPIGPVGKEKEPGENTKTPAPLQGGGDLQQPCR